MVGKEDIKASLFRSRLRGQFGSVSGSLKGDFLLRKCLRRTGESRLGRAFESYLGSKGRVHSILNGFGLQLGQFGEHFFRISSVMRIILGLEIVSK